MELGRVGWKNIGGGEVWIGRERSAGCRTEPRMGRKWGVQDTGQGQRWEVEQSGCSLMTLKVAPPAKANAAQKNLGPLQC